MSVQICKNGCVKAGGFTETNGAMLNTFTSEGYTPANVMNSCMGKNITGFEKGKQYYIELSIVWSGFKTNAADNFSILAQGAAYDDSAWVWSIGNPMTSALGNFKTLVLSADSGEKLFKVKFTANCTGYQLGCRADYSNGSGTITYKNIRVVPADSYVDGSVSGGHILADSIAMDNFIEN